MKLPDVQEALLVLEHKLRAANLPGFVQWQMGSLWWDWGDDPDGYVLAWDIVGYRSNGRPLVGIAAAKLKRDVLAVVQDAGLPECDVIHTGDGNYSVSGSVECEERGDDRVELGL
jgi:hypothetical protein